MLRSACTELGLHPQADPANNHKNGYMKLLATYRRAQLNGEVFSGFPTDRMKPKPKRIRTKPDIDSRTKDCGFKLINVVFSPAFIDRMMESGAIPSSGLQVEPVDGRTKYWRDVATAYTSGHPEFNKIAGPPGRYDGINLQLAPPLSSAILCTIWKDITTKYEECFSRWKQLGTDNAGFAHFCGDSDVLYLHDRLQIQPLQVSVDPNDFRVTKRARTDDVVMHHPDMQVTPQRIPHMQVMPPQVRERVPGTRIQQVLETNPERRRENAFEGIIYSSQAVRDTMEAIEALKRGRFDGAVIAQAEESMDAIVHVWLRELNNASQPRTG
ncbi:hypothetical protein PHMEG_00013294 [Phytophthora megakarya]|uniref:Uncharacterized protein n=1 Tax=Phytophthora megakarya TaxID=4795 RepID=A0A225W6L3_9STRA|nr:hypothetical protein PHMEG_00013294 [Phytophthora megakarya]